MKNTNHHAESRLEAAARIFHDRMERVYHGVYRNAEFDHADDSGFWFHYEFIPTGQTDKYCVRLSDMEGLA